ncbi:DUF1778 domain-containing protein [Sphingopyxis sp. GC21]|uniref:type II toxin-antitoxin system TacA family antitoxin n=1 Tax=Sphingopyxis sp. GC21 TaxID=2933562 RepID=UPI0021E3C45C|nr:DUF1778 domain-containing protein [Sphingopyxis sp. GC21]
MSDGTAGSSWFQLWLPHAEKSQLIRAAEFERTSLKDFVLRNALIAVAAVIEKAERLQLDEQQTRFVLDLLDNPPAPNAKLLASASPWFAASHLS